MRFAHAWRRRGMWATAVTLVVPGALAVAVAVALLGGGFRGLGAVGQIFTGPEVPKLAQTASHAPSLRSDGLPTVPAAPRPRLFAPAAAGPVAAPGMPVAAPLATVTPRRPIAGGPGGAPTSGAAPAAPAPAPGSPPARPSNPVREAGESAAEPVGTLPPPAGPAGHDTITTVLELVPPPPALAAPPLH